MCGNSIPASLLLILFMFDTLGTPTNGICQSDRRLGFIVIGHTVPSLSDECSENGGVQGLWQTVIHGFVKEFVDDYKIISNGFFFECTKVIFEYGR
jgi:hypothetical protein